MAEDRSIRHPIGALAFESDTPRVWAGVGRQVWVVMGNREDELLELLGEECDEPGGELTLCRAILDDGVLVVRQIDPDVDPATLDLIDGDQSDSH